MTTENAFAVCGQQVPRAMSVQQELRNQQQNHREFREQTSSVIEQAPVPDTSSSQWHHHSMTLVLVYIKRSLDKVEQYLNCPTALAELIVAFLTWPF